MCFIYSLLFFLILYVMAPFFCFSPFRFLHLGLFIPLFFVFFCLKFDAFFSLHFLLQIRVLIFRIYHTFILFNFFVSIIAMERSFFLFLYMGWICHYFWLLFRLNYVFLSFSDICLTHLFWFFHFLYRTLCFFHRSSLLLFNFSSLSN